MKHGKRWLAVVLTSGAAIAIAVYAKRRSTPPVPQVQIETVARRDLVSSMTATGQLGPHTKVDVIADVTGRVMRLAVREGEYVTKGQFLLEIDPSEPRAARERAAAAVAGARASETQARTNLALAQREFGRTASLQHDNPALVAEDEVDKLRTQVALDSALLDAATHSVEEATGSLQEAESALAKTTITAPMSGQITRLGVAEGETAIPGTFSRDAATLLTISDMSMLETKLMVPEADVARLEVGDSAAITIQAMPDSVFPGRVEAIANSSARDPSTSTATQATPGHVVNYEVIVRLLRVPPHVHPDFTATATIVTATRHQAVAVPIIALTVRELPAPHPIPGDSALPGQQVRVVPALGVSPPGGAHGVFARRDAEGVFVVGRGDTVHFQPVTAGIMGDRYVEVVDGLAAGERVIAGPYEVIRDLKDSAVVRPQ